MCVCVYLRLCHVDAHEEDQLGDEEVEAEVLVDGVAVALQAAEEAEGEEADGQAHQRHGDAHPGHHCQQELMHAALPLPDTQAHSRKG